MGIDTHWVEGYSLVIISIALLYLSSFYADNTNININIIHNSDSGEMPRQQAQAARQVNHLEGHDRVRENDALPQASQQSRRVEHGQGTLDRRRPSIAIEAEEEKQDVLLEATKELVEPVHMRDDEDELEICLPATVPARPH